MPAPLAEIWVVADKDGCVVDTTFREHNAEQLAVQYTDEHRAGAPFSVGKYVPEIKGHTLVPIVPTLDMITAGYDAPPYKFVDGSGNVVTYDDLSVSRQAGARVLGIWYAMIDVVRNKGRKT